MTSPAHKASAPSPDLSGWRVRVWVSTWCAYAGLYFCRKAFFVVKGPLQDALGLDTHALGEIGTAYLLAYAMGQFVAGWLGTRTGARVLLLGGIMVSLLTNVVFGVANGYWTLLVFMVVNGFAQATGWPATVGTLGHWTRRSERGTVMGIWSTCYQLGGVMATGWAAFWLGRLGYRASFFAASAVLLAVWVLVLMFVQNRPEDVGLPPLEADAPRGDDGREAASTARWPRALVVNVVLMGTTYLGVKFVRYALWSWAPFLLQRSYGLDGESAGYLSTVFDVAGFLGVIAAGVASDRFANGRRATVAFVMLVGMVGSCLLLYLFGAASILVFAITMGLVGFTLYGPDSLLSAAGAVDVGTRQRGLAAAAIINGMGSVGAVVQELVVSRVYAGSEGAVGPVFVTLLVAAATSVTALSAVLYRNRRGHSDL